MKTKFTLCFLLSVSIWVFSQVGINTETPQAMLDVKASNENDPSITDGILIPRVDRLKSLRSGEELPENGMLVFLRGNGFYYHQDGQWISLTSEIAPTNSMTVSITNQDVSGSYILRSQANLDIQQSFPIEMGNILNVFGENINADLTGNFLSVEESGTYTIDWEYHLSFFNNSNPTNDYSAETYLISESPEGVKSILAYQEYDGITGIVQEFNGSLNHTANLQVGYKYSLGILVYSPTVTNYTLDNSKITINN